MGRKIAHVAVVQETSPLFDTEATLQLVEDRTRQAARAGAQLVMWPEAFVGGYPRGANFGVAAGVRTQHSYRLYERYASAAVTIPGPALNRLAALAAELGIHLVIGVIERDGGTLYCTIVFLGPDGYLGKHRKVMPTSAERLFWGFGDGSTLPVLDTPLGRMGAVICWENYMPLLRAAMYGKGIELYLAPTADGRDTWLPTMRHIAIEGRCFVLTCNQVTRLADLPTELDSVLTGDAGTVVSRGGSCIVDPFGTVVAGPLWDEKGILYAELDLSATLAARFDLDAAAHYARPDIFQLTVNEEPLGIRYVTTPPDSSDPEGSS